VISCFAVSIPQGRSGWLDFDTLSKDICEISHYICDSVEIAWFLGAKN
jgi:hypothetical protein